MDIDALHSALVSLTILPEELRETREELRLAHGDVLPELTLFLESIERDLRLAKAALAREIGFPVCHCCWPPELIVTTGDGEAYCAAGERREQHLAGDNCVTRATEHSRRSGGPRETSGNQQTLFTSRVAFDARPAGGTEARDSAIRRA
jgi:hypothetical protein